MQSNNLHTETFDLMLNNAKKMYDKIISTTSDEELCLTTEELKIVYDELINSEFSVSQGHMILLPLRYGR